MENPVTGQFISYMTVGTEIANRVGLNITLPVAAYTMYGANPNAAGVNFGAGDRVGLHDLRLDGRVRLWNSDDRNTKLGAGVAVFLPTGSSAGAVAGDGQTSSYIFGSVEHNFGPFFLAGNIGPHLRANREITGDGAKFTTGNELRWALGAYVPLRNDNIRLGAEFFGTTGLGDALGEPTTFSKRNTSLEWLAQARFKLDKKGQWNSQVGAGTRLTAGYGAPDLRVLGSIGYWFGVEDTHPDTPPPRYEIVPDAEDYAKDRDGDGYPDDIDKCPDIKEDGKAPFPTDGCPADADRDGDGIPDAQDACPDVPEDKDGVADTDGCPETDADNDGIADGQDKCPTEPGPASKIAEKNGCPSLTKFSDDGEIQLLEPIQFETGKATIKAVSFPILDEVVTLMKSRTDLKIGVHGHTDDVGNDANNLRLSKDRAAACMKYLSEHGVAPSRLQSEGFGEAKPLENNGTPGGRARNRRVEFKVIP